MHIERIKIKNFRLLQDFSIDLQKDLSLVVGKNNSGKTSLLKVMDKFINGNENKFTFEDFSLPYQSTLATLFSSDIIDEEHYQEVGIFMNLLIKYTDADDLEFISPLVSLELDNYYVSLQFAFSLPYTFYGNMRTAYSEFTAKENAKKAEDAAYQCKTWQDFLTGNINKYFHVYRYALPVDKEGNDTEGVIIDLQSIRDVFHLEDVISFRSIDARRSVDNRELDNTLSGQTSKLYQQLENSEADSDKLEELRDKLREMDEGLSQNYGDVFTDVIDKVRQFGGIQPNDTIIKIVSNLQQEILLKDHTRVVYEDGGGRLPESHNGLGYMNLISMIFEIESIRRQFARHRERKPADINFLVIEEPEAHTHPQMQYIFIKNIKQLLQQDVVGKDNVKRKIQSVVTTHSAHIVAECDFEDLKYLKRDGGLGVISKNMTDLEKEYAGHTEWYKFLKQYITLDRSELFFADKAIFVEGDTERILMPSLMKISDNEMTPEEKKSQLGLTSQNISIVSVGNYTHIFTRFFNFIGFKKICVITDLDICNKEKITDMNGKEREVYKTAELDETKVQYTTNSSLSEYLDKTIISDLRSLTSDKKVVSWDDPAKKWKQQTNGNLMVCYQTTIDGYQPRSFEDAFFATNKEFMKTDGKSFSGLKDNALVQFVADDDCYKLAQNGIKSKATFAVDLLVDRSHSDKAGYVGWQIPGYIKEGLSWIRKD